MNLGAQFAATSQAQLYGSVRLLWSHDPDAGLGPAQPRSHQHANANRDHHPDVNHWHRRSGRPAEARIKLSQSITRNGSSIRSRRGLDSPPTPGGPSIALVGPFRPGGIEDLLWPWPCPNSNGLMRRRLAGAPVLPTFPLQSVPTSPFRPRPGRQPVRPSDRCRRRAVDLNGGPLGRPPFADIRFEVDA
jgi:hypothetical protein